jgi:hypothetical protein
MSEPSPNPSQQIAEESAALTNGTTLAEVPAETPADVDMADSIPAAEPVPEAIQEVPISPHVPLPTSNIIPAPTHRPNRTTYTRADRATSTTRLVAQQSTSQRAGSASAYAADTSWKPDESVFEPVCYAAFAGGDEASGDE